MSDDAWIRIVETVAFAFAIPAIVWAVAWCVVEVFREAGK